MAKKVFTYDVELDRNGQRVKGGEIRVVQADTRKKSKADKTGRYDYVDSGRGAKDAANAVANGLTRLVFGKKK